MYMFLLHDEHEVFVLYLYHVTEEDYLFFVHLFHLPTREHFVEPIPSLVTPTIVTEESLYYLLYPGGFCYGGYLISQPLAFLLHL